MSSGNGFSESTPGVSFYERGVPGGCVDIGFRYIPPSPLQEGMPETSFWFRQGTDEDSGRCAGLVMERNWDIDGGNQKVLTRFVATDYLLAASKDRGWQGITVSPVCDSGNAQREIYRGPVLRDRAVSSLLAPAVAESDRERDIPHDEVGWVVSPEGDFCYIPGDNGAQGLGGVFSVADNSYRSLRGSLESWDLVTVEASIDNLWNQNVGAAAIAGCFSSHSGPC
jgi:hypothetical protein